MATIRAKYANGVLTPLEPLNLEEGKEVTVSINGEEPPLTALGAIVARVQAVHETMPPEAWDGAPRDLAKNLKHYLYGHPKEEDE